MQGQKLNSIIKDSMNVNEKNRPDNPSLSHIKIQHTNMGKKSQSFSHLISRLCWKIRYNFCRGYIGVLVEKMGNTKDVFPALPFTLFSFLG
jgi:hypothetical protein